MHAGAVYAATKCACESGRLHWQSQTVDVRVRMGRIGAVLRS